MEWTVAIGIAAFILLLIVIVLANPGKQHIPEEHRAIGWHEDTH